MNSGMKETAREMVSGIPKLILSPAFLSCPGCQHSVIGRIIAESIEELGIEGETIGLMGVGCAGSLIITTNVDAVICLHGRAPDVGTAIKRVRPDTIVYTMQGDGDCIAIGADPLVGALTRGENITVIMCNNANYGTTGGQLAPTTLTGQVTTTTPGGRNAEMGGYPAHAAELAASFKGAAYSARGAVHTPVNYQRTRKYIKTAFQKQIDNIGFSFVEVLSACPPNWHLTPVESLKWIEDRMIPEFPLGEFKNVDKIE